MALEYFLLFLFSPQSRDLQFVPPPPLLLPLLLLLPPDDGLPMWRKRKNDRSVAVLSLVVVIDVSTVITAA